MTAPAQESRAQAGFVIEGGATLIDCSSNGSDIGIKVGPNGVVRSSGLRLRGNRVGIDNAGQFDGPDTKID